MRGRCRRLERSSTDAEQSHPAALNAAGGIVAMPVAENEDPGRQSCVPPPGQKRPRPAGGHRARPDGPQPPGMPYSGMADPNGAPRLSDKIAEMLASIDADDASDREGIAQAQSALDARGQAKWAKTKKRTG